MTTTTNGYQQCLKRLVPKHCENVTRWRGVFSAVQTRSELTNRLQEIEVVASDVILRHVNDRWLEGSLEEKTQNGNVRKSRKSAINWPRRDDKRTIRQRNRTTGRLSLLVYRCGGSKCIISSSDQAWNLNKHWVAIEFRQTSLHSNKKKNNNKDNRCAAQNHSLNRGENTDRIAQYEMLWLHSFCGQGIRELRHIFEVELWVQTFQTKQFEHVFRTAFVLV